MVTLDPSTLDQLIPIKYFPEQDKQTIYDNAKVLSYCQGSTIYRTGRYEDYVYYLLDGKVLLTSKDGIYKTINSDTDNACYPLLQAPSGHYTAVVVGQATILRIERIIINKFLQNNYKAEINRIKQYYQIREQQIREVIRQKNELEKRIDNKNIYSCNIIRRQTGKVTNSEYKRLKILNDVSLRKRINSLNKTNNDDFQPDVKQYFEKNESKCTIEAPRKKIDIQKINEELKRISMNNQNNTMTDGTAESSFNDDILVDKTSDRNIIENEIDKWLVDQDAYENSPERLELLRKRQEVIDRIRLQKEHYRKISKVHDKALITELDVIMESQDKDKA